jgi:hypothetical protein
VTRYLMISVPPVELGDLRTRSFLLRATPTTGPNLAAQRVDHTVQAAHGQSLVSSRIDLAQIVAVTLSKQERARCLPSPPPLATAHYLQDLVLRRQRRREAKQPWHRCRRALGSLDRRDTGCPGRLAEARLQSGLLRVRLFLGELAPIDGAYKRWCQEDRCSTGSAAWRRRSVTRNWVSANLSVVPPARIRHHHGIAPVSFGRGPT